MYIYIYVYIEHTAFLTDSGRDGHDNFRFWLVPCILHGTHTHTHIHTYKWQTFPNTHTHTHLDIKTKLFFKSSSSLFASVFPNICLNSWGRILARSWEWLCSCYQLGDWHKLIWAPSQWLDMQGGGSGGWVIKDRTWHNFGKHNYGLE